MRPPWYRKCCQSEIRTRAISDALTGLVRPLLLYGVFSGCHALPRPVGPRSAGVGEKDSGDENRFRESDPVRPLRSRIDHSAGGDGTSGTRRGESKARILAAHKEGNVEPALRAILKPEAKAESLKPVSLDFLEFRRRDLRRIAGGIFLLYLFVDALGFERLLVGLVGRRQFQQRGGFADGVGGLVG